MNLNLKAKAEKIKLVAFDVDGVMTDGSLTFAENGMEIKTYNAKDGLGVNMLNKAGIITAIITARVNETVRIRAKILDIKELYEGQKDKLKALDELCSKYNLSYEEIAYMGDDLPDLCVLERVGLSACPNDAVYEVQDECKFISSKAGGKGAVREFCDFILKAKRISWKDLNTYKQ